MTQLSIKRDESTLATVEIDEKTIYSKKLMGEHKITVDFILDTYVEFQLGDYIEYGDNTFTLNRLPQLIKINENSFEYRGEFEAEIYTLYNKIFLWGGIGDFSYTGTAEDFLTLILSQINEIDSGWTAGDVDETTQLTMEFDNESCRAVLARVAETFELEFALNVKEISLEAAIGEVTGYEFQYGKSAGLYKLTRDQISDQNIVTKVYGFGSRKNIPYDYRDRAKRLIFADRYLENNVDLYGTIEGQFTDENIFPNRTGTITAVLTDVENEDFYVEDTSIDFDLNDYLLEGEVATIVFKTGDLSGYEFDIWRYDHDNKRIWFIPFSEEDGYTLPTALTKAEIGDTYTLVNFSMPQSYVDTAETNLESATQTFLDQNSVPKVIYSLEIDPKYIKDGSIVLNAGDMITINDSELGISDLLIRVSELNWPLVNSNKISAVISDSVPYTLQERIIKQTVETKKETVYVERRSSELARRNSMRQNQLRGLLFDTDGYFDNNNIRPLSVETLYLAVGTKSSNFKLSGVTIEPNFEGDENTIAISAGSLIHLEMNIADDYTWIINTPVEISGLTSNIPYYVYAKCSTSALTGAWIVSENQITVEQDAGFYHFLVGILFDVVDDARDYDFTYGMTYINGRVITTGRIQSIDELNYFDLDSNQLMMGDATSSLDWNVTVQNQLTLKGAFVQSPSGAQSGLTVYRGGYDGGTTYYLNDLVTYGGSTWRYINGSPASGQTPSEGAYWTVESAAGTQGDDGADGSDGVQGADGADGSAGADGRTVNLTVVTQGFSYDTNGANPSPADAVVTATAQNTTGTVYYEFILNDETNPSEQNTTSNTWTYTPQSGYGDMPDKIEVQIREGGGGGTILARDQITIVGLKAGVDSITIVLSNEAHTLPTQNSGGGDEVDYTGSGTTIKVWEGTTALNVDQNSPYGSPSFRVVGVGTNVTANQSPSGNDGQPVRTYGVCLAMSQNTAYITFTISVRTSTGVDLEFVRIQSLAKSIEGDDGAQGNQGLTGPSIVSMGEFSAAQVYYNNDLRRDVVFYPTINDLPYLFKGTDGTSGAWSAGNWEQFGATFSSVATDILFAKLAYIDNLGVRYLQTAASGTKRIIVDGSSNNIQLLDSSDNKLVLIDDDAFVDVNGSDTPGIKIDNSSNSNYSQISSESVVVHATGTPIVAGITGAVAIKGNLKDPNLSHGNSSLIEAYFVAGLYGKAVNSGNLQPWSAYLFGDALCIGYLYANGIAIRDNHKVIYTSGRTFGTGDNWFILNNSSNQNYTLPSPSTYPNGAMIEISNYNNFDSIISRSSGGTINGTTGESIRLFNRGDSCMLRRGSSTDWVIVSLKGDLS